MKQTNKTEIHILNEDGKTHVYINGKAGDIVGLISEAIIKIGSSIYVDPSEICSDIATAVNMMKKKMNLSKKISTENLSESEIVDSFFEYLTKVKDREKGTFTDGD